MNNYVVLAIGNVLLSDDGVGAKVLAALEAHSCFPADTRLVDGGTLSFSLESELDDCAGLIVVDASRLGTRPGTVECLEGQAMDRLLQKSGRSVHEVGLADVLDVARLTERLPSHRALIGIEPDIIDWGENLSPAVQTAVPLAAYRVLGLLATWRREASTTISSAPLLAVSSATP